MSFQIFSSIKQRDGFLTVHSQLILENRHLKTMGMEMLSQRKEDSFMGLTFILIMFILIVV